VRANRLAEGVNYRFHDDDVVRHFCAGLLGLQYFHQVKCAIEVSYNRVSGVWFLGFCVHGGIIANGIYRVNSY